MNYKRYLGLNNPDDLAIARKMLHNIGKEELNDKFDDTEDEDEFRKDIEKYDHLLDNESDFSDSETGDNYLNHEEHDFISKDGTTRWAISVYAKM